MYHNVFRALPWLPFLAPALPITLWLSGPSTAQAGCMDFGCGRIDWTEVTEVDASGAALEAMLHGGYSWESSNNWTDGHPLGGTLSGYMFITCINEKGAADPTCVDGLANGLALAGTGQPLGFGGSFYDFETNQPLQPGYIFAEGAKGSPTFGNEITTTWIDPTHKTCQAAFGLPINEPPDPGDDGAGCGAPHLGGRGPLAGSSGLFAVGLAVLLRRLRGRGRG